MHPGQYLNEGTELTTLQGVDEAAHVDFTVAQRVAAGLRVGDSVVRRLPGATTRGRRRGSSRWTPGWIPTTRNATVRARIVGRRSTPAPGASVRVLVPAGRRARRSRVPVSALRKGPAGDHVFVIAPDYAGKTRAHRGRCGAARRWATRC